MKNSFVAVAVDIAVKAHHNQFRKWSHEPYLYHPMRVAGLVQIACHDVGDDVIAAAWLHDVVENTSWSLEDLKYNGVSRITLDIVKNLTKPNANGRKRSDIKKEINDKLSKCDKNTKLVKLADRLDNLSDMVNVLAPKDFVQLYCKESIDLLDALKGTNHFLEEELKDALDIVQE